MGANMVRHLLRAGH
ncbi:MAG: hypothetical protein LW847_00670, partial [Burkholderiales bacterium]|nr:hypothetical protein [Burkholderiales bacterium]